MQTLKLGLRTTPGHASGASACSQKPTGIAMIRHIVFFTAINDDNIESIRKGLQMLTGIPHAQHLEISLNRKSDPNSKEIDVVVYGEFADDAALAAYKAHETYAESIRRVKPLRELRFAVDYDQAQALTAPDGQA